MGDCWRHGWLMMLCGAVGDGLASACVGFMDGRMEELVVVDAAVIDGVLRVGMLKLFGVFFAFLERAHPFEFCTEATIATSPHL